MRPSAILETRVIRDRAVVVAADGELDLSIAAELKARLVAAVMSRADAVILDLTDCSFIDSSALNVLVRVNHLLDGNRARLSLVTESPHILRVLEITQLDLVLEVHPDLETALKILAPVFPGAAELAARRPGAAERGSRSTSTTRENR